MIIKRDYYLNQLIAGRHNGLIKIITGLRRSGKSYLLFKLFVDVERPRSVTVIEAQHKQDSREPQGMFPH